MQIRVVETPDDLADLAAASIARLVGTDGPPFSLGLAGGGTPRTMYTRLRDENVAWARMIGWMGDERWVPPDHPDSNARMARESLFDHVPARLLEVPFEGLEPDEAAAHYAATLRRELGGPDGRAAPDLVLLGLGDDGHTASLFPDTTALNEHERIYVANHVPRLDAWRLTATLPLMWAARRIMFLVTGEAQARIVADLFEGSLPYPARRVMEGATEVTWFLDTAAASRLTTTPRQLV